MFSSSPINAASMKLLSWYRESRICLVARYSFAACKSWAIVVRTPHIARLKIKYWGNQIMPVSKNIELLHRSAKLRCMRAGVFYAGEVSYSIGHIETRGKPSGGVISKPQRKVCGLSGSGGFVSTALVAHAEAERACRSAAI